MKKLYFLLLVSFISFNTMAQTTIGGTISIDSTLDVANSPYLVTSSLVVGADATLTIESGVSIAFNDNLKLEVFGKLLADGVEFSSSSATPTPGIWTGIELESDSTHSVINSQILYAYRGISIDEGAVILDGTDILNSGQDGIYSINNTFDSTTHIYADGLEITGVSTANGIYAYKTALDITNSSITAVEQNPLYLDGARTSGETLQTDPSRVTNTSLSGNDNGLVIQNGAQITLGGNTFTGNGYPIRYNSYANVTYESSNTYSDNTYQYIWMNFTYISGDMTLEHDGIPYVLDNLIVNEGRHLTIEEGVITKFLYNAYLQTYGKLTVVGTEANPVIFTSYSDDNAFGDSNKDGNDTDANSQRWQGIYFEDDSDDLSSIDYADIRWARYTSSNGGVVTRAASPSITNSEISNCYYGARFEGDSNPTFSNNIIGGSDRTPIGMAFEADPTLSDNVFSTSDNEYDAIGLFGGTLTADANIVQRDFTDIPNVTYVMLQQVTVPEGLTLTIAPGVVIKLLDYNDDFIIHGELDMQGTEAEPIIITSIDDDVYGNPVDTRNDGTDRVPTNSQLGGIFFSETSSDASIIDHAILKFMEYDGNYQSQYIDVRGSSYYFNYDAAIAVNDVSPTITNTVISDSNYGIDYRGTTTSTFSNNEIINTTFAPVRISIASQPTFSGNTFNSVGHKALAILPEVINGTATLGKRDIAGFENVTYTISALAVNEGANVIIEDGLILKVFENGNIDVFGSLNINGTEESPVIITALADDNEGASDDPLDNDTEDNGNATDPTGDRWDRIRFYSSTDDENSIISHAIIKYGQSPVQWSNAGAPIDNVDILFPDDYGLYMEGDSDPIISNVFIQNSVNDPIAMSFYSDPTFTDIVFDGNGSNGVRLIDGTLSADATLDKRDIAGINNIAYITAGFTINSGASITVNPGVVLKFLDYNDRVYVYEGKLEAVGTASEPIVFTSYLDDSRGGDTNNDGNGTSPDTGNWEGFYFGESTMQSHIQYCEFRYGSDATGGGPDDGHVVSYNNNLLFEDNILQLVSGDAFGVYGTSTATFRNNRLENIANAPIQMDMFADPTFEGNTFENLGYLRINIREQTFSQDATIPFRSFAGYDSLAYGIDHYYGRGLIVNSGTKITVPPGIIFRDGSTSPIFDVEGELLVQGSEEFPVVFTDFEDDDFGYDIKDIEFDGESTGSIHGGSAIIFRNVSDDNSLIENAIFRYYDAAIKTESASPTLHKNVIEYNNFGLNNTGISEPTIVKNRFKDLTFSPFATSMVAYPDSTADNTLEGTTYKTIWIQNETLTQDTILFKRSFGGIENIPYTMSGYTIGLGVKLTIEPGVMIKFTDGSRTSNGGGSYFRVRGALVADGGPNSDSTIVFTSESDDFYGGDSNSDSTLTAQNYNWAGFIFDNESSDSESIMDNVIIRYATASGILLNSASPTISNSQISYCGYYFGDRGAIDMDGASNPTLIANDFIDNRSFGVRNTGSFEVDATGSWWGDNSGPYEATLNPDGKGDPVVGNVLFDPWASDNSQNPTTGDVSLNGVVSAYDAALTLQEVAGLVTFNERQERAGDVTDNDEVSAMDASYILQYAAGLIESFPAEAENKRVAGEHAGLYSEAVIEIGDAVINTEYQEVLLPISVSNVANLYALSFELELDEVLDLVAFEANESLGANAIINFDEDQKTLYYAFGELYPMKENLELGTLKLMLNRESVGFSSLTLLPINARGNETNISANSVAGQLSFMGNILSSDDAANDIAIYPNPVADFLEVKLPGGSNDYHYQLIGLDGSVILSGRRSPSENRIEIPSLESGLYLFRVQVGDLKMEEKIVVNQ